MAEKTLVILISGRGSNMEALLDARLPARIAAVISNNPLAPGLGVAKTRGVATAVVDHRSFADRAAFGTGPISLRSRVSCASSPNPSSSAITGVS
jgi:folate-dependent phosphoribosylglycinamide formyltransferase PurN